MTTKAEMVAILKAETPTLQVGNDAEGYIDLAPADYEAVISERANNRLAKEAEALKVAQDETAKAAILAKLGITKEELKIALG